MIAAPIANKTTRWITKGRCRGHGANEANKPVTSGPAARPIKFAADAIRPVADLPPLAGSSDIHAVAVPAARPVANSLWLLIVAKLTHSMPLLLCATALGGLSAALGYRGSLEEANRIAPSEQRSEFVSSYLIAVYGGNSVPIIGIGLLAAITSSTTAHVSFAAIITALACIALIVGMK